METLRRSGGRGVTDSQQQQILLRQSSNGQLPNVDQKREQGYRAKSEVMRSSTESSLNESPLKKREIQQQQSLLIKQKLEDFERNLLNVSTNNNKSLVHLKGSPRMSIKGLDEDEISNQKRRIILKNFNQAKNGFGPYQLQEKPLHPYSSVYALDFADQAKSAPSSPASFLKLPSIQSTKQHAITEMSPEKTTRGTILSNTKRELERAKREQDISSLTNAMEAYKAAGQIDQSQEAKISSGINELKELRRKRKKQRQLKNLQELQNVINNHKSPGSFSERGIGGSSSTTIEEQIKAAEMIEKLYKEMKNNSPSKGHGRTLSEDCLSRVSEDSLLHHLDEISMTDDEEIDTADSERDPSKSPASISNASSKKRSKTSQITLESILEENADYFDHLAGKCACGDGLCGRQGLKCKGMQNKPQIDLKWQSSYQKYHSETSLSSPSSKEINELRLSNPQYKQQLPISQDYNSMSRNDYKVPVDSDFKRVSINEKIKEGPLYSLSSYKANYVNWKPDPTAMTRDQRYVTTVQNTPLLGISSSKQAHHEFGNIEKTGLAKPRDQGPLPRFTIEQSNEGKMNTSRSEGSLFKEESFKPQRIYTPVPSFEGQFKSQKSKDFVVKTQPAVTEASKTLEQYQRKIEKYKLILQKEIEEMSK